MTRSVYTLTAMQSLPLAESMMGLLRVRHIPVVDDERRVVGLVTHRDLLAAKISALAPLSDAERSTLQLAIPVARVMRSDVWTIAPDALAVSAARIMREHRFGCLPVVDDGRLAGIITEADLLALVTDSLTLERRAGPPTIGQVMTRVPVTITPETPIAEARAMMGRYHVRHLPVVDGGRPVCMVSDRDLTIAEAIFGSSETTRAAHVVRLLGDVRPHVVDAKVPLETVLEQMLAERLDAVVVTEKERLVGIFTATDACRALATSLRSRAA